MNLSEKKVHLIPFKVEAIQSQADEIPYGVKALEAPKVWKKGEKGKGIVVAIIDTGIDKDHPDLKDRIIGGRNFTSEGSPEDYSDANGHGTHVAGTIGASENDKGVVGVAPEVSFLICKVLGADGSGSYEGIINAINYATDWVGDSGEKVRVMNMSLGGSADLPELHNAIKNAVNNDIVVVVASGNEGDNNEKTYEFGYPAMYSEVIEVSAHDENYELAYFANNNLLVDVIASGVNVISTYPNSSYARLSGTSMATPHVTGAIALLINLGEKKFQRKLLECEIYAHLAKNTLPIGYLTSSEGHGVIKLNYLENVRKKFAQKSKG
jgi:major intracellular serine protease